jgi:hypothetical protein
VRFLWVEGDDTWVSDGTLLVTTFAPGEKGLARPTARLGSGTGTERAEDVLGIVVRTGSQLRCVIDVTETSATDFQVRRGNPQGVLHAPRDAAPIDGDAHPLGPPRLSTAAKKSSVSRSPRATLWAPVQPAVRVLLVEVRL